jgi:hypothetical protein
MLGSRSEEKPPVDWKHWLRLHWDRLSAWALTVAGVVVLLIGWKHIADTPFPAEQVPYIVSAGIGGGLMVVFGAALLISADLRDEWHKLDRIETVLRSSPAPPTEVTSNGHVHTDDPSAQPHREDSTR